MKALRPLLLLAMCVFGCAHRVEPEFQRGKGDVREFILSEAIQRGGVPVTTNDLPSISGRWRYKEDEFGVVLRPVATKQILQRLPEVVKELESKPTK